MGRNIERDEREAVRRKEQLIHAGFELFSTEGIENVSMNAYELVELYCNNIIELYLEHPGILRFSANYNPYYACNGGTICTRSCLGKKSRP